MGSLDSIFSRDILDNRKMLYALIETLARNGVITVEQAENIVSKNRIKETMEENNL